MQQLVKDKIDAFVDEAMRLGAALGSWTRSPTGGLTPEEIIRVGHLAGNAALRAARKHYVDVIITIVQESEREERSAKREAS